MSEGSRKRTVAALDPGRDKCGLAVLSEDGTVLLQKVIATDCLEAEVEEMLSFHAPDCLLLGNGTTSKAAESRIRSACPQLEVTVVEEHHTTEMARKEYWKANPPKGWRSLLPTTLQVPPVPVDDFVAVILARRYFGRKD